MKQLAQRRIKLTPYLYILPFMGFFALFNLYPLLYGFIISFLDRNNARKLLSNTFVWFENYHKALTLSTTFASLWRTVVFTTIFTALVMGLGFLFAVLFNKEFVGRKVARSMFYMPYVTNLIAVGIVFKYLFNPSKGPVNALWRLVGESGPEWLLDPSLALILVAVIGAWAALAFNVITILAALQEVPRDLYEVAQIEGVNPIQRIRYVTLPLIAPHLFTLLTITLINSFKNFTTIIGLTGGGPGTATQVMSLQIYNDAFIHLKFGIAAAEGVLFTLFIFLVNSLVNQARKRWLTHH